MYFDKIINTAYSFGAAIVVFGAWGKIEHKDFGDTALTVGLLTETSIFIIYGLMEWRRKKGMEEQEPGGAAGPEMRQDTGELASVLKQTNQLLGKIFRAD